MEWSGVELGEHFLPLNLELTKDDRVKTQLDGEDDPTARVPWIPKGSSVLKDLVCVVPKVDVLPVVHLHHTPGPGLPSGGTCDPSGQAERCTVRASQLSGVCGQGSRVEWSGARRAPSSLQSPADE